MNGAELRRLRLRLRLTQVQMARQLGLFVTTIANYERGRRQIPTVVEIALRCIAEHGSRRSR